MLEVTIPASVTCPTYVYTVALIDLRVILGVEPLLALIADFTIAELG